MKSDLSLERKPSSVSGTILCTVCDVTGSMALGWGLFHLGEVFEFSSRPEAFRTARRAMKTGYWPVLITPGDCTHCAKLMWTEQERGLAQIALADERAHLSQTFLASGGQLPTIKEGVEL